MINKKRRLENNSDKKISLLFPKYNLYSNLVVDQLDKELIKYNKEKIPLTLDERITKPSERNIVYQGDLRIIKIKNQLDDYIIDRNTDRAEKIERSSEQTVFHKMFIIGVLPIIYAKEWDVVKSRVMKEYGIKMIPKIVVAIMERRGGKSFFSAMFWAAMFHFVPNQKVPFFSQVGESSIRFLSIVKFFLLLIDENYHDRCNIWNTTCIASRSLHNEYTAKANNDVVSKIHIITKLYF